MSEIYPIDDLEWENNSVSNALREPILNLPRLEDEECADLLDALNELEVPDLKPVAALVGLAPDAGSLWATLRVGELKTLLALAIGDQEATREGCSWVHQLGQVDPARTRVYRCIESLIKLGDMIESESDADDADPLVDMTPYRRALLALYGEDTLRTAEALLNGDQRFFNLDAPGLNLQGCQLHQALLAAYDKIQEKKRVLTQ
jgi:ribosomal protein S12 methylthiotransferase accessory factor